MRCVYIYIYVVCHCWTLRVWQVAVKNSYQPGGLVTPNDGRFLFDSPQTCPKHSSLGILVICLDVYMFIYIYTHNFTIMYIYFFLRWFRLPASNHSFHHEADLTGTLRKRKRNIIEVEHQMILFCSAQPFFFGYTIGTPRWLQKGFFFEKVHWKRGGIFLPKKSSLGIYLRQCTCLLDGKVVGQAAKGERFFGGKCDKCPNNSNGANV